MDCCVAKCVAESDAILSSSLIADPDIAPFEAILNLKKLEFDEGFPGSIAEPV